MTDEETRSQKWKWKYPYGQKIRDSQYSKMLFKSAFNIDSQTLPQRVFNFHRNNFYLPPKELELLKFVLHKRYNHKHQYFVAGAVLASFAYYLLEKQTFINNEVGDPGREIIYERLLAPWARNLKNQFYCFFETNAMLRLSSPANKEKHHQLGYENWKMEYMKHLQQKHFKAHKNDLFEFLEITEGFN